jgi:DNA mismatch repair protein MutS
MLHLKDDLASGYSHFMTEIKALKNVLESLRASKRCFAIFDELFRGTNEEDALAILRTTVRGLAKSTNGHFLMSTHLQLLKEEVEPLRGKVASYFIECNIQQGLPVFSFKLKPGWSELKIGQLLFQQEGLDKLLS